MKNIYRFVLLRIFYMIGLFSAAANVLSNPSAAISIIVGLSIICGLTTLIEYVVFKDEY